MYIGLAATRTPSLCLDARLAAGPQLSVSAAVSSAAKRPRWLFLGSLFKQAFRLRQSLRHHDVEAAARRPQRRPAKVATRRRARHHRV